MDEQSCIPRALIDACFELGLMGIEIPEEHGGSGATFFMSTIAIEELARVDPAVAVLVDVQNTLVNNALLRCGNEAQKAKYFPRWRRSGWEPTRSARRARARTPSRSPAGPRTRATTTRSRGASSGSRTRPKRSCSS
jgi:alkylation response protein AidB-like acyl-CoA dehydrogenase